jgi:chromosome segregation ATPase
MMVLAERMLSWSVHPRGTLMPISATLSHKILETFGEKAAKDMVDWMNRIDSARSELRDLNDTNARRFDAKFEQIDARFEQIDARFEKVDARFEGVDARFDKLEGHIDKRFGQLETSIANLQIRIEQRTADLMKWSFMFWLGAVGAIAILAGIFN